MTIAYWNGRWVAGLVLGIAIIAAALLVQDGSVVLALALGGLAGAVLFHHGGATDNGLERRTDPLHFARVELARARRRNEEVDVLVAVFSPAEAPPVAELIGALRITDGVGALRSRRALEVCAVIAKDDSARPAIERRLSALARARPRFAWASFPADGVTLEALILCARSQLRDPAHRRPVRVEPEWIGENGGATVASLAPNSVGTGVSGGIPHGPVQESNR